jgi:hypothetical protein
MRNAIAELSRQGLFAALACAFLAAAFYANSGAAPSQSVAHYLVDPPILVKTVAFDAARLATTSAVLAPASAKTPATGAARGQVARRACAAASCPRRLAALPVAPRPRPAAAGEAAIVKVALTPAAPHTDLESASLQDRFLLRPVGNFRDRVVGLISSL